MAQLIKNPPAVWETWVQCLGWEDPLEKGNLPIQHSGLETFKDCIVCGGHKGSDMTEQLSLYEDTKLNFIKMKCKPELYLPSIKLRKDM